MVKFSAKYSKTLDMIQKYHNNGHLVNLTDIYNLYGKPAYLSPRRVIRYRQCREMIKYCIVKTGYKIEEVVKYSKKDIFANKHV